jgi:hypothetical protein
VSFPLVTVNQCPEGEKADRHALLERCFRILVEIVKIECGADLEAMSAVCRIDMTKGRVSFIWDDPRKRDAYGGYAYAACHAVGQPHGYNFGPCEIRSAGFPN